MKLIAMVLHIGAHNASVHTFTPVQMAGWASSYWKEARVDGHCRNEETHQQLNNNKSSTTLGECYEMCHELTAKTLFVEGTMVSCFSSIL